MAFSVQMPALGESVTEGTVTRWLKHEGDRVEVDEPLLEVSTDKVDTEIPSPAAGVLQRIVVSEDETVEVGAQLALIGDAAGDAEDAGRGWTPSTSPAPVGPPPPAEATAPNGRTSAEPEPPPAPPTTGGPGSGGTRVTMPALGESVTEGTVTRWLKRVGDQVEVDEPLLEVSTDKVDTEIPSPVAGTVLEIDVREDETVEVGAQLAVVGAGTPTGDTSTTPPLPPQPTPQPPVPPFAEEAATRGQAETQSAGTAAPSPWALPSRVSSEPTPRPRPQPDQADGAGAPYVTPLVRKLAAEHGVDLSRVSGTGVGGRIRKQDVLAIAERTAEQPTPAPAAAETPVIPQPSSLRGTTEKMSRLRSVIAERMVESLQVSAQLTTVVEADVTRIARLREHARRDFEAREGVRLSFLPFFARAVIEALKQHPKLNASIDTEHKEVTYHGAEHLGVAVDTARGLLVPVIHDAGDLNIAGLARKIEDLAARTRAGQVTPDELAGGTFTLSSTGSRGALFDTPIILQPQVGILGAGAVIKRPVVAPDVVGGDTIAVRSMVFLALSYDHRLVDGADAARFLATVRQRLEAGAFETELGL